MLTIFIYSTPPAIFPKYILDIIGDAANLLI